jgi:hypothetical protein
MNIGNRYQTRRRERESIAGKSLPRILLGAKRRDLLLTGELSPGVTKLSLPDICEADEAESYEKSEYMPLGSVAEDDRLPIPLHLNHHSEQVALGDDAVWFRGVVSSNEESLGVDSYYPMENEPLRSRKSEGNHISQADRQRIQRGYGNQVR